MISFKSKVTQKLLSYFFLHEDSELYLNEIVDKLKLDKRNLSRKLNEFVKAGLFIENNKGNQNYYRLNKEYSLYNEYKKIVLSTFGIESVLKNIFKNEPNIDRAYIFGSYVQNSMDVASDIDILVVGDISAVKLNKLISKYQRKIDREINPVIMDEKEFNSRKKEKNTFIENILKNNIRLI